MDISISAHSRPISFLKFNSGGSLVATSSSLGTVVKLFNSRTGDCVGQFRRGTLTADIQSMSFSFQSDILAVASSKGTIHFFSIAPGSNADPGNAVRSEIKYQFSDLNGSVICFSGGNRLCVALRDGKVTVLQLSGLDKVVTVESSESFVEMLVPDK
jgi:WD40 repeat protein